jgi:hypothetical protein
LPLLDGTKAAPPDGSTMPVWSVAHLANRVGLTETLPLIASSTLFRPDARAAIQLVTRQAGTIAFEVNQGAINALRRHLGRAEQFLRQRTAKKRRLIVH